MELHTLINANYINSWIDIAIRYAYEIFFKKL